ncbi:MAG TPA: hypothetical protein VFC00_25230 [Micromonosporaceae bacterium]|nr:hypothetical protein [Micromonosporaceae bacterium]
MSPRRNYRRPDAAAGLDPDRVRRGVDSVQKWSPAGRHRPEEQWADGDWRVRAIPGGAATKVYRCPGCDQEIGVGVAHVVAWPIDRQGDEADRRHWHSACWRARSRRYPTRRS